MRRFDFKFAFLLSVAIHLMVMVIISLPAFELPSRSENQRVTIDIVQAPPSPPPAEIPPVEPVPSKQIVDQSDNSLNDEKPKDEAYLSAHDQTVQKETAAKERGEFRNAKEKKSVDANPNAGIKKVSEKKVAKQKPTIQDLMGTSPVAMMQHKEEREQSTGDGSEGPRGSEASRTSDYLKEVDDGAETMLNTREFKYYTYYSRIRRQLSQYWEPKVRDKLTHLFKQGRRIASDQDHITKLLIVLNMEGNLVRVQVLSESGVSDLDEAATEAFRSAAPFPNPPKGIVEDDGTVKIRWDFVLES